MLRLNLNQNELFPDNKLENVFDKNLKSGIFVCLLYRLIYTYCVEYRTKLLTKNIVNSKQQFEKSVNIFFWLAECKDDSLQKSTFSCTP